jgi:monoamine oxidase
MATRARSERGELAGRRVIVAGAGLAGLSAARDLEMAGAVVTVCDARDRLGGRVHTIRHGLENRQHAEAGADLIEGEQSLVLELASALQLKRVRILRAGFEYYTPDKSGRRRTRAGRGVLGESGRLLKREIADYCLAGKRWDSAIALCLARQSVADWLDREKVSDAFRSGVRGLRGFFLADPQDLSLIALVDQFASGGTPGQSRFFRIQGGNDRLPHAIAGTLHGQVLLETVLRKIRQHASGVHVTVDARGKQEQLEGEFCVVALPASTLRDVVFDPVLPDAQVRAITTLKYGPATRMLLQFEKPFWRQARRARAFGSDLPTGAVWDGAEDQRARSGILSLLAGGRASRALRDIVASEGPEGVVNRLSWLGKPAPLLATQMITWEDDRWSRGGYAVFDPSFDPRSRAWLARPAGRLVFAGEHTSLRWQGYMSGAIESGRRAAAEIRSLSALADRRA